MIALDEADALAIGRGGGDPGAWNRTRTIL